MFGAACNIHRIPANFMDATAMDSAAAECAAAARRSGAAWGRWARRLSTPVALLLLWQIAVDRFGFGNGFVPSPIQVVEALQTWMFGGGAPADRYSGTWRPAVIASTWRVAG